MKDTPHIYVVMLSLAPQAQGQGICSRLMRGVNAIADQLGWVCYLETGSERLESIYKHFGYETVHAESVTAKCDVDTDWPTLCSRCMVRQPVS